MASALGTESPRVNAALACSRAFSVFVLCAVGVGIAFGSTMYAFAVGHLGVEVVSCGAMVGAGAIACRAVRAVHVALDDVERRALR
jgi:hypothetical protein